MKNKYVNLLKEEPGFIVTAVIVLLLFAGTKIAWSLQKAKEKDIVKIKQELALVAQIPQMEKQLADLQPRPQPKKGLAINGIYIQDNHHPIALIGEQMYEENDTVQGFIIAKITADSVILIDKDTKAEQVIYLNPQ